MEQQQTPEGPTYWQQPPQRPVEPWNVRPPGMSGGQIAFNVIILLLLIVNTLLVLYVFGVVHQAVNAVHSVSSFFGG